MNKSEGGIRARSGPKRSPEKTGADDPRSTEVKRPIASGKSNPTRVSKVRPGAAP